MHLNDWFQLGDIRYRVVSIFTFVRSPNMKIVTFESDDGKDYKCNVWSSGEVFYIQEMKKA